MSSATRPEKKGQYAIHRSHPRHPPNERASVEGQLWKHGERVIVQEPATFALNAHSWQFGRINEGVTPEQRHAAHCNSQQVEGSVGWDRHSSGDLRNRQMDGQDEGSRRIYIYNQRDLMNRDGNSEDTRKFYWWSIRREEKEFILERGPRTDFDPLLNYTVDDPIPQESCLTVDEVLT